MTACDPIVAVRGPAFKRLLSATPDVRVNLLALNTGVDVSGEAGAVQSIPRQIPQADREGIRGIRTRLR